MLSKHMFIGRLTADPEVKEVNGRKVATFTVACDDPFSKNGDADFYRCVAWNKTADLAEKHLVKGRLVHVEGRPKNRSYMQTKDGVEYRQFSQEIVVNEVTFLDKKESGSGSSSSEGASENKSSGTWGGRSNQWGVQKPAAQPKPETSDEMTIDDVPF